jgi:uncharacterized protein (TIGR02466 family)
MQTTTLTSIPVFPIAIVKTNIKNLNLIGDDFDIEINEILDNVLPNRKLETANGEYSTTLRQYQDIMTLPSLRNFNDYIRDTMQQFWTNIGYTPAQIAVERSWINRFSKGSKLHSHAHGSTEMVMTYYHKIPQGSAAIKFFNPFENYTGMAPFKEKSFTYIPEEGDLLAWPGFLWHEIDEQAVNEDRIAISMNVHQGSYCLTDRWRRVS